MSKNLKLALTALAVVAVLVPLYGKPDSDVVTHTEWAGMLLRGLDLDHALPDDAKASLAFGILSWKTSLSQRADAYLRADGLDPLATGPAGRLRAVLTPAEAAYPLAIVRAGDYRVRLRLSGLVSAQTPARVELARADDDEVAGSFDVVIPGEPGWVEAGTAHLSPGSWVASVELPEAAVLEYVEVAPPCLNAIEPPGGWRALATTDDDDLAVTLLKAVNAEAELPPAATPIDISGDSFRSLDPTAQLAGGAVAFRLDAGMRGIRALVTLTVPKEGLYTISVFGVEGAGQRWLTDACLKSIVCGTSDLDPLPNWHPVATTHLSAGNHMFNVALGPGATVERLRLELKKTEPQDYVATVKRLGFDPGPDGPITRAKAREALRFLQQRYALTVQPECGDWDLAQPIPGVDVASVEPPPPATGPPVVAPPPPPPPPGPAPGPVAPPPANPPPAPPQTPGSPTEP